MSSTMHSSCSLQVVLVLTVGGDELLEQHVIPSQIRDEEHVQMVKFADKDLV